MNDFFTWVGEQIVGLVVGAIVTAVISFLYYRKHIKQIRDDIDQLKSGSLQNHSHSQFSPRSPEEIQLEIEKIEKRNEMWGLIIPLVFFLGVFAIMTVGMILSGD